MAVSFRDADGTTRLSGDLLASGGATGDVLTQQADGTYAPAAGGTVSVATATLTNAQVKALAHPTPVTVVAAPGAGFALVPVHAMLRLTWVADYGGIDPDARIGVNNGTAGQWLDSLNETAGGDVSSLLAFGEDATAWLASVSFAPASPGFPNRAAAGLQDSEVENKPVCLFADNATLATDFTGGNAGNSLKVTLLYYVVTF